MTCRPDCRSPVSPLQKPNEPLANDSRFTAPVPWLRAPFLAPVPFFRGTDLRDSGAGIRFTRSAENGHHSGRDPRQWGATARKCHRDSQHRRPLSPSQRGWDQPVPANYKPAGRQCDREERSRSFQAQGYGASTAEPRLESRQRLGNDFTIMLNQTIDDT